MTVRRNGRTITVYYRRWELLLFLPWFAKRNGYRDVCLPTLTLRRYST